MAQIEKSAFILDGDEGMDYTPNADVNAGDVIALGASVGIARHFIKAGTTGALDRMGVYDFLKKANDTFAIGDIVYYDPTNNWATSNGAYSAHVAGQAWKAAAGSDATVRVYIHPAIGT